MKKILFILLIAFPVLIFGQPRTTGEIMIDLVNYGSSWNVTFEAEAIGGVWDENYYVTSSYSSASVTIPTQQHPQLKRAQFDLVISTEAGNNPIVGIGLYRISAVEGGTEKAYFYMDWRTTDYDTSPDVYFLYDYSSKHFRNAANTQTIDGTHQTIWNLVEGIDHNTSGLELYLNVSNQGGNPYLSWNAYHDSNILGYNIYQKITLGAGGTQTNVIFTTSTSYLDDDFEIDPKFGDDQVEYWIKAKISSSQESLNGNHVQLTGDSFIQWKLANQESSKELYYKLSQNYPNPFNPSTILSYHLKEASFVNLTVYNSIGESVTELVNQRQEQGNYSIEFNALNLPSGIYFYKIQTDKFSDVKKMILLR
ncbi:MAG: T9SS type A sorting domain-containing protein [Ignavibacteriaceae bacterium]|nr:T9SS type A sorting domain-containing protein [Ignavibacteriaceae bacterium]